MLMYPLKSTVILKMFTSYSYLETFYWVIMKSICNFIIWLPLVREFYVDVRCNFNLLTNYKIILDLLLITNMDCIICRKKTLDINNAYLFMCQQVSTKH